MGHRCHVPKCATACPPRMLMCAKHWRMVPGDVQHEVYRTVGKRGKCVDASWAPWWRAQAKAIDAVLRREHAEKPEVISYCDKLIAKELAFANTLESRQ